MAVEQAPEGFRQFWGIPEWVWIGIVLPWCLCTLFTVAFSAFWMKDDDLGTEAEGKEAGAG